MRASYAAFLMVLLGCAKEDGAQGAKVEPVPTTEVPTATSSAQKAPPEPPKPPTMKLVPMNVKELTGRVSVHTIDGAVIVAMGNKVGRLLPDGGVEWVGEVPKGSPFLGDNIINDAFGQWPEEVAVAFFASNGRAPVPTYYPVRGGGGEVSFAPGGGAGNVSGAARVGETTTIAGYDFMDGYRIIKVRGPMVKPVPTSEEQVGCIVPEDTYRPGGTPPAIPPNAYAATRAGTIISFGEHCRGDKPALEIWKKPTEPGQIIMLDEWYKHGSVWEGELFRGAGDTMYLVSDARNPILRYRDGKVEPLPLIPRARRSAFVSPEGTLYSGNGGTMFELVGDRWEPRFHLAWPDAIRLAKYGDKFITSAGAQLQVLEPTASIALDPEAAAVECKTPFIHWADVNPSTTKGHNFPDAAKRLSSFEHVDRIEFVEFEHGGRRLGIVAKDWESAKGALKHIIASGKDEAPRLICFAPEKPRVIKVAPAKKK